FAPPFPHQLNREISGQRPAQGQTSEEGAGGPEGIGKHYLHYHRPLPAVSAACCREVVISLSTLMIVFSYSDPMASVPTSRRSDTASRHVSCSARRRRRSWW